MLFVSHLLGADIMDSADQMLGKVSDFICRPNGDKFPSIVAITYRIKGEMKAFEYEVVENLSRGELSLKVRAEKIIPYEIKKADFLLARDILDKQIVDLQGTRVVRVNDLRIGIVGGDLKVLGIDVSNRGLLRRLGFDRLPPFSWMKPTFIDWENIQVVGNSLKLSKISDELVKLHPADLANIVEDLNPHQSHRLVEALEPKVAAEVFGELDPEAKKEVLTSLEEENLSRIMTHIPVDELVDYLKTLRSKDQRKIMASLSDKKKKTVRQFLKYEDDTAGGLMTTEYIKASPNFTVAEAREHIRDISEGFRSINFIYVVNEQGLLQGIVSMRALIIFPPAKKLRHIMKKVRVHQTVHVGSDIEHVANIMTKYNLHTVAVLGDKKELLGLVTVDDILRHFVPKA
jgi:magnesium transporter